MNIDAPLRMRLAGVGKSFDGVSVLDQVNFDDDVSALAIIGPSGGGKSTLLRIIGGLLEPTSGSVEIGGVVVDYDEQALRAFRKRLGFVFQDSGLFHHMNALENVALPLRVVHGVGEEEARKRSLDLFERLGITAEAEKLPAQLSGGQRQRVAIARALSTRPELILLDEPTSALDPEYTTEVLDVIRDMREEGTRFIIVTHEMGFARHACDHVAFLYQGRLMEYGESAALFGNPQTDELKRFLGRLLEWSV